MPDVRMAAQLTTARLTGEGTWPTVADAADRADLDQAAASTVIVAQAGEWRCADVADEVVVVRVVAGVAVAPKAASVVDMAAPSECTADRSMAGCSMAECSAAAIVVAARVAATAPDSDRRAVVAASAAEGFMDLVVRAEVFMVR